MEMRFEDWPRRLQQFLADTKQEIFEWGCMDCGLFMADGVVAITGWDPAAAFRGRYKTARGAAGALRRYAGGGLADAMGKALAEPGWSEIRPAYAQRGDAILFDGTDIESGIQAEAAGICLGARFVYMAPSGQALASMTLARRAWRVG